MGPGVRCDDPRKDFTRTGAKPFVAAIIIPSPSLPRRDDLDLVAALERCLRPLAARQHVVIQRDRKMRALIFEFAEQRVDAAGIDLALLAVDGHAHCITSLSITPRLI